GPATPPGFTPVGGLPKVMMLLVPPSFVLLYARQNVVTPGKSPNLRLRPGPSATTCALVNAATVSYSRKYSSPDFGALSVIFTSMMPPEPVTAIEPAKVNCA